MRPTSGETAHSSGLTLRSRGFPLLWQQRLVGSARWRRRLDAQLALQGRRAHVVHPKRPHPVTACVVKPHEEPVRLLAQRVVPQEPLGVQDRPVMVAVLLKKLGEALEGLEIALAEPLALSEEPLVVAPLEKVSRVQLDGLAQGGEAAVGSFLLRPRE